MSTFKAGVLALSTLLLLAYFGFTKANPFSNPYELHAVFRNAQSLKPRSPVRIAGVEVGKVTKIESSGDGDPTARVKMELKDEALPLHDDARLQRWRRALIGKGRARPIHFLAGEREVVQPHRRVHLVSPPSVGARPHRSLRAGLEVDHVILDQINRLAFELECR